MARKVFFSFKYDDVWQAMNVRNSDVIEKDKTFGFIDKAEFEKVERQGDTAIKKWIDTQMDGTTVTVVLVGANTDKSKWVKYEIDQSIKRGNGILTIDIRKIKNQQEETANCCGLRVEGYPHYSWDKDNGRKNLGKWVEKAAVDAGK